ncbi:MAG: phosphate signaling complex protein PhoU [Planctomycetota bacterium]|nr:phosphate signaling complex protein PhoU [Planctomycetota bacterium]
MAQYFHKEVAKLKRKALSLSALVEQNVHRAVHAAVHRDADLARQVIESDAGVDQMEVEVEEDCLKILALHQPVAIDLRFIVAILKLNNDLERMGDLSVNIAERALGLAGFDRPPLPFDLPRLAEKVQEMLKKSLDALVELDPDTAKAVLAADDEVDALHRRVYEWIKEEIRKDPGQIDALLQYLSISRNLERIADHATNVAEDVVYMVEGEIVRHSAHNPAKTRSSPAVTVS